MDTDWDVRPRARQDIDEIADSIAQDNRAAGRRFYTAAQQSFRQLADMPGMGRELGVSKLISVRLDDVAAERDESGRRSSTSCISGSVVWGCGGPGIAIPGPLPRVMPQYYAPTRAPGGPGAGKVNGAPSISFHCFFWSSVSSAAIFSSVCLRSVIIFSRIA
jgi:plasmid stabilization system protein ParE